MNSSALSNSGIGVLDGGVITVSFHVSTWIVQTMVMKETMKPYQHLLDEPFSMKIDEVFHITASGTVLAGKIGSGKVKSGDELVVHQPSGDFFVRCRSIEGMSRSTNQIGIVLSGPYNKDILPGSVVESLEETD